MNEKALDFETSLAYITQKSNRVAWGVSFVAIFIAVLSVIAVLLLTPLKTVEPYVIRVNETTGMVDILTILDEKQITSSEALDKHFITQYVKAREGYYFDMLNNDYIFVQLLSSPEVAAAYREIYSGENARDVALKNNVKVEVKILSVVLGESSGTKTSTVRANLIINNKSNQSTIEKVLVITLSYDYFLGAIKESDRILNPLGFKVTNYRTDEEIAK